MLKALCAAGGRGTCHPLWLLWVYKLRQPPFRSHSGTLCLGAQSVPLQ